MRKRRITAIVSDQGPGKRVILYCGEGALVRGYLADDLANGCDPRVIAVRMPRRFVLDWRGKLYSSQAKLDDAVRRAMELLQEGRWPYDD